MTTETKDKKLPSFSNEPQKFGPMTLFMNGGDLCLHVPTDMEFFARSGVPTDGVAAYYENYETRETARFRDVVEVQIKHTRACLKHLGEAVPELSPEEYELQVMRTARYMARRQADNCDDNHDLSEEFCAASHELGKALRDRFNAGIETMKIVESYKPAETFINMRSLRF